MKQSRNGYKLLKFPQKILADLFVYTGATYFDFDKEDLIWQFSEQ